MAYTTINKPTENFNTKLYTGTGATNAITGVGFQPDFVWTKRRDSTSGHHVHNSISGATKYIFTNDTAAESTDANKLDSFDSDGFTVGTNGDANASGGTFASWNFKGGGTGVSNTDGTITSTVSANTTAGFSIATWSGTGSNGSIGHGLGGVDCMIIKDLSNSRDFYFWQKTMAYNTRLELNNTEAFTTGTDNMTALPDATKINMAVSTQNNGSGNNYVGYFFQEKQGYSKFGSYVGNGSTDGTFVYTGFKPAFVICKVTSGVDNWILMDNKRLGYNAANYQLLPNSNLAEVTPERLDLLSNGFKCRNGNGEVNGSGQTYIYMAFAEAPLVGTNGVTAKAR